MWGAAACAALTVQSTRGLRSVHAVASTLLVAQVEELLSDLRVGAIKTGALGSAANARALAALLGGHPSVPVIVDPVMIPTRRTGADTPDAKARLDGPGNLAALCRLASVSTLLTPNLNEAAALLRCSSNDLGDPSAAALSLLDLGGRAVLLKGGHGEGDESVDWLALRAGRARLVRIAGPRRRTPPLHGTGCTLASLIAGKLAALSRAPSAPSLPTAEELVAAVRWARARLDRALLAPVAVGTGLWLLAPRPSPLRRG